MKEQLEKAPDTIKESGPKERYELRAADGKIIGIVKAEYRTISNGDLESVHNTDVFDDPANILQIQRLEIEAINGQAINIFDLVEADTSKVLVINDYKYNECSEDGVVYIVKPNTLLRFLTALHELGHLAQIFDTNTPSAIQMREIDSMQEQLVTEHRFADAARLQRRYSVIDERNATARSLQWMRMLKHSDVDCFQPLAIDDDVQMVCELVKSEFSSQKELVVEADRILESGGITFQEFSHFVLMTYSADESVMANF